eukprot:XP_016665041.1 PREDICTED: uncharacterized protein LOC107885865 [Acyrthosiphon pisum]
MKDINGLKEIEENIKSDDDYKTKMKNLISSIGGTSIKNFVKRVLGRLFSNKLASECSWSGFKNNFRLDNLTLIMIVKEIAYEHFKMDDSSFENIIKDWFRHGSQRLAREDKRN